MIWYYDTLDIAPYLKPGENEVVFLVLRFYAASRTASPFERTAFPGLTVFGSVSAAGSDVDLASRTGWEAQIDESVAFPSGLIDDFFLHVCVYYFHNLSTTGLTASSRYTSASLQPTGVRM